MFCLSKLPMKTSLLFTCSMDTSNLYQTNMDAIKYYSDLLNDNIIIAGDFNRNTLCDTINKANSNSEEQLCNNSYGLNLSCLIRSLKYAKDQISNTLASGINRIISSLTLLIEVPFILSTSICKNSFLLIDSFCQSPLS